MDLRPTDFVPAPTHGMLSKNASGLIKRGSHQGELMLVPGHIADIGEVTLDGQGCVPLLRTFTALVTLPLMHSATVSVGEDMIDVVKEQRTEEGVFVADHCTKS